MTAAVVPVETLGLLLLMRAFADGCSAITGVEAVSNGVPAFAARVRATPGSTLTVMGAPRRRSCSSARPIWPASAGALPSAHETVRLADRSRGVRDRARLLRPPARDDGHPDPRGEHGLRRLPATVVPARPRRLHAQPLRVPRRAPGLQRRDRGPGPRCRSSSSPPSAAGRGADPAVRHRRVHVDHPVAGRDGPPLVARARRRVAAEHRHQRGRGGRDRRSSRSSSRSPSSPSGRG